MAGSAQPAGLQDTLKPPGAPGLVRPGGETWEPLTASLIRFFSNCGMMKAAAVAAVQSAK
jgi:hypothetical protein